MRLFFSITTYNRSHFLERLIKQIANFKEHTIHINIVDDASDLKHFTRNMKTCKSVRSDNIGITYYRRHFNAGKKKYWKVINEMFKTVKEDQGFDYYFILPDDFILTENFINESIRQYEMIQDEKKICLSLFIERERLDATNWVDTPSELQIHGSEHFYKTQWMDMCIISKIDFYKALDFKMDKVSLDRWKEYDAIGSGVGAQITKRLNKDYSLYHVSQSLCYEEEHVSMMNPNRSQSYTIHNNRRDLTQKVYVGIASIPSREKMLQKTINSLIYQVDRIFVYLNGYENVPEFLKSPRITVLRSQDSGDLGDAGKFVPFVYNNSFANVKGYYFSCDDDLIYPGDYVYNMINFIENNNRKAIIGIHGVILNEKVKDYYRDRQVMACLNTNPTSRFVHILGTGALAFHTSTIDLNFSIDDLQKYRNMADLHFAVKCQQNKIPMLCVKHDGDWLWYQDPKETIFDSHKNNCFLQTELVNSIPWKIHTIEEQYLINEKEHV